jgi:hypothetical protein
MYWMRSSLFYRKGKRFMSEITMTIQEAESAIEGIRSGMELAKQYAYELWSRRGWTVLCRADGTPYRSFYDCIKDLFGERSASQVYRLKDAKQVELNTGRMLVQDTHARLLQGLASDQQRQILDRADEIARTEKRGRTAEHVSTAKTLVEAEAVVTESGNPFVQRMVATGEITVLAAAGIVQSLERLPSETQYQVMQVITECGGLTDPALIVPLADMVRREASPTPSRTLAALRVTGTLAGVPLARATMTDLQRAKIESQAEIIADAQAKQQAEAQAQGKPYERSIVVTLIAGNPQKTIKALRAALSEDDWQALCEALMTEEYSKIRR